MKIRTTIFILILALAAFLRLYHLLSNPVSLYWDETSISYNAYSLNLTGKDEWGNKMPLMFESFGDYKLPLFVYLVAVFQKVVGFNDLAVRLPSAVAGILTVALLPLIFSKNKWGLLAAFFLAISPWHLQFSRAGFEANVSAFFTMLAVWLFLLAVNKNIRWLFVSMLFFVAAMYTYHSAIITTPLIILLFLAFYFKKVINQLKGFLIPLIFAGILLIPFLYGYVLSPVGRTRAMSENIFNRPGWERNIMNNYTASFSTDFLFFKGDQNGRHSVKKIGELYLWQLPLVLAGLFFVMKSKPKLGLMSLGLIAIGSLPPALTTISPHALRGLLAVIPFQVLIAYGLVSLSKNFSKIVSCLLVLVCVFGFFLYLHIYYIHYPKAYAPDWQDGQRQTVNYLSSISGKYSRIILHTDLYPIYLLWYLKFDPAKLQVANHSLDIIGKYYYSDISPDLAKQLAGNNVVIALPAWDGTFTDREPIREINDTSNQPFFRVYEF